MNKLSVITTVISVTKKGSKLEKPKSSLEVNKTPISKSSSPLPVAKSSMDVIPIELKLEIVKETLVIEKSPQLRTS